MNYKHLEAAYLVLGKMFEASRSRKRRDALDTALCVLEDKIQRAKRQKYYREHRGMDGIGIETIHAAWDEQAERQRKGAL